MSFDGQLRQEYSYQNYENLIILFLVTINNVRDPFLRHSKDIKVWLRIKTEILHEFTQAFLETGSTGS